MYEPLTDRFCQSSAGSQGIHKFGYCSASRRQRRQSKKPALKAMHTQEGLLDLIS